jgi:hypothetical protein
VSNTGALTSFLAKLNIFWFLSQVFDGNGGEVDSNTIQPLFFKDYYVDYFTSYPLCNVRVRERERASK